MLRHGEPSNEAMEWATDKEHPQLFDVADPLRGNLAQKHIGVMQMEKRGMAISSSIAESSLRSFGCESHRPRIDRRHLAAALLGRTLLARFDLCRSSTAQDYPSKFQPPLARRRELRSLSCER